MNSYAGLMAGYAGSYSGVNGSATGGTYNTGLSGNAMPWIDANGLDPASGGMGTSQTSYLYLKLSGEHITVGGGGGSQMPTNGSVAQEEWELLKNWIEIGAPEFGN